MKNSTRWLLSALFVTILVGAYLLYRQFTNPDTRSALVLAWLRAPQAHPDWAVHASQRCGSAPFIQPTNGFIGYLWDDSFRPGHRHQGLDIFGGSDPGQTPVYAAFSGYLTRQSDWKSSLIIRIPEDPLRPGRQIWTYYTHMASPRGDSFIDPAFPPGTHEVFVEAGTLLGLQGNFSGDPGNPVGVHLHFSIILDDGQGMYRNELEIANTLDPSPYFNLPLDAKKNADVIPVCGSSSASQ